MSGPAGRPPASCAYSGAIELRPNLATMVSKVTPSQPICHHLPAELWAEIISYLPRYTLKSLLIFQPHPLGIIASHNYFSTLSLHLGVSRCHRRYVHICGNHWDPDDESVKWHDELMKWHNKRSHDILITIVESDFGNRIQKLRIYAGQTDTLGLQMGVCFAF
jgi:hypothetical protein